MSKKKKLSAALLVAIVMASAAPVSQAHQHGSIGAGNSELVSLPLTLTIGPPGPRPPPK